MLKIRPEQMKVLSEYALEQFVRRATDYLQEAQPERVAVFSPAELAALVRHGVQAAKRHGITAESDILRYLELAAQMGVDFGQELPWARHIVERKDLWPWEKLQKLEYHLAIVLKGRPAT